MDKIAQLEGRIDDLERLVLEQNAVMTDMMERYTTLAESCAGLGEALGDALGRLTELEGARTQRSSLN